MKSIKIACGFGVLVAAAVLNAATLADVTTSFVLSAAWLIWAFDCATFG